MKNPTNHFLELVEIAMREQDYAHMRPVIEKELLHRDILFALDNAGLLDRLTFQGGTALRLCFGAPRFSEDLDFVGGYDFETKHLLPMKTCLEDYLTKHYGLHVNVKEPKDLSQEPINKNVTVSKWQLQVIIHPGQKDIPQQKIKIEVANIPAHTKEPKQVLSNYTFLPDGYSNIILLVETLDEILADKLVAFVDCQPRIRHRDIWDIHWLQQQGAKVNMELIELKIQDYKINDYLTKLDLMLNNLSAIIHGKEFTQQMSRFLPMQIQNKTLSNPNFLQLLFLENSKIFKSITRI